MERRPKWKMTKIEDDQNGRRPKWKMTKMEDKQNGSCLNIDFYKLKKNQVLAKINWIKIKTKLN